MYLKHQKMKDIPWWNSPDIAGISWHGIDDQPCGLDRS
jgi:hypothetical protein